MPVEHWHGCIGYPTIADAILDRLMHRIHRITLAGGSMRKTAQKRAPHPAATPLPSLAE
ncbi:ATP-binding protein [Cupriavidus oxalaticus]|uniref:ATP-binding protein n=1 Tax=Cupriavidus oxalaticus TaxID=96344 RepID=UPI001F103835|nr:ATP-binding protein [Cupriavidus oxalaticus]